MISYSLLIPDVFVYLGRIVFLLLNIETYTTDRKIAAFLKTSEAKMADLNGKNKVSAQRGGRRRGGGRPGRG